MTKNAESILEELGPIVELSYAQVTLASALVKHMT